MVGARVRRQQVASVRRRGLSSRRACAVLSVARSTLGYQARLQQRDAPALAVMRELAGRGQGFAARRPLHEALGMGGVGREARVVTDLKDRGRAPRVDVGGREIAQATVVMRVVVPREEIVADRARVFDREPKRSPAESPGGI